MADLSHLDGAPLENPDRLSDAAKENVVTGNTVKSLDTGHTEASLKDHMAEEMKLLAIGNGNFFVNLLDGLLGELIELIKKYLKDPFALIEDGVDLLIKVGGGALALGFGLGEALFGFLSDIGGTIVSLFTNEPRELAPAFSELRANLEADVAPFMESFKKNGENAAEALGKVGVLREEVEQAIIVVEGDIRSAEDALKAIGDVDKKIADQALIHIRDSEEALEEAKGAMEALVAYKDVVDPKIQSALADSKAGLDRLGTLEPKVTTVISDLAAYEEATNLKIQDLLGKASGAITDAGQALTQYDELLSEYEGFKTEASGSLEALRKSSTTQGQKLGVIEGDMPGIKTSITNVFALAETAQSTVDNLVIGVRNWFSYAYLADRTNWSLGTYSTPKDVIQLEPNTEYTFFAQEVTADADGEWTVLDVADGTDGAIPWGGTGYKRLFTAYNRKSQESPRYDLTVRFTTPASGKIYFAYYDGVSGGSPAGHWVTDKLVKAQIVRGSKIPDWSPSPEDVEAGIAKAQAKADQAAVDAEEKANAAREAAELYAKEKSEADAAQALVDAKAEAARLAKAAADQAILDSASDADVKLELAEAALKEYADAQADAAKEAAEATAAADASTKANKAKADAEAKAATLATAAQNAAATALSTYKGVNDPKVTQAQKDAAKGIADALAAKRVADQATLDAASKAEAARVAAELYAKEKSEADVALAEERAAAEAARVAKAEANAAKTAAATDATNKVAAAQTALKTYTDAEAKKAKEGAEATAALDATTKANKAKADAEKEAKRLSDIAAAAAATAQATANQAKADAESKANAARVAAEKYAKEKSEADAAQALVDATAEAARVAQEAAAQAVLDSASDADTKVALAESALKAYAEAQAAAAQEAAEATAALDATTKANKAKTDAEANAKKLSDAAAAAAAAAQATANQAKADAESKANAARVAAEKYAKEKSEADTAASLVTSAAEALRVAKLQADAAKTAAATDAKAKADEAERLAKLHADAQAKLAKEQAEATAALDATTKANQAKADAEANAKVLSDKAQQAADEAQASIDNLQIGGRNLLFKSAEWHFATSDNSATVDRSELGKLKVLLDGSSWNAYKWITGFVDEDSFFDGKSTYTVSVELRVTSPGGGDMEMSFDVRNPAGSVRRIVRSDRISDTQGKWVKASATITLPNAEERRALFALRVYGTSPGDLIEYRHAKIERGSKATDWTPAPEDVAADIAAAQAKADQATMDAEQKANDARIAAELYAKEKSEADVALAEERAAAEALRVARLEATAAKDAAAVDAKAKADEAERLAKVHADAQAKLAKEGAEATAALDATTKANKAKADAEKEAKRLSDIAAAAAAAAQSTANQAKAAADVAVTNTVVEYAVGTSETTAPTTGWSTSTPTRTPGRFVWMRSRITYGSGTTTVTSPALLTGNAGATGAAGKGITTTVISYTTSASGTTTPTTGWVSTLPTVPQGHFLWTRTVTSYTSGAPTNAYAVTRQGTDGTPGGKGVDGKTSFFHTAYATNATGTTGFSTSDANGKTYVGTYSDFSETDSPDPSKYTWQLVKGADGADGKGVKTSVVTYAASTSGTSAPASGWVSTIPTVAQGSYLWTRTITTFTDGATTTVTAPSRQGVDGDKGDQGVSVTAVTPHYQLVTKGATAPAKPTAATPSGWSTTEPAFAANRELYRADKVAYSNGTFTWTDVSKVSAYTAAENVQTNLDNLQIGGRNLLRDGDFKVGRPLWTYTTSIGGGAEISGGVLKVIDDGQAYQPSSRTSVGDLFTMGIASVRARGTKVNVGFGATPRPNTTSLTDQYQWYYFPLTHGAGNGNFVIEGTAEVTHVKLEKGNKVTDWTPAPEDTEAEIAAAVQASADALNTYRTSNDKAVSDANDAATAAAGVAQAKGEVIYQATAPTGARAAKTNLWIRTSDNKPHTYNGTKWVEATDKVATDAADKAATALSTAQAKTTTYYGSSTPSGTKTAGDLWLDSGSDNALKRWSGSAWVVVRDGQLAKALQAAGDAQSTADGKVRSFAQSTAPTGMTATDVGDIWLDTDDGNKMYRWSGTSWVTMQDHLAVQAKSVADTATTKAETAQSTVDNLEIGGRNLLLDSHFDKGGVNGWSSIYGSQAVVDSKYTKTFTSDLPAARLEKNFVLNETGIFTFTIYMKSDAGIRWQGFVGLTALGVDPVEVFWHEGGFHAYSVTFRNDEPGSKTIRAYSVNQKIGDVYTIDWEKLERGNKATDWTPAPEDVDKSIADVDYKASETEKLIPGMQDAITGAHGKAETAQSTVDNLEIGGRNLFINSNFTWHAMLGGHWTIRSAYTEDPDGTRYLRQGYGWGIQFHIPVEPGTYTFSVDARDPAENPNSGARLSITALDAEGNSLSTDWGDANATVGGLTSSFKRFKYHFTFPEGTVRIRAYLLNGDARADRSTLDFSRPQLEKGNKATDWSPAPEDVDKSIADVDYKASETEKLIPGMQDAITGAHGKAEEAQSNLDNLQIGGRNYFLKSGDAEAPVAISSNNNSIYPIVRGKDDIGAWIAGHYSDGSGWMISAYVNPLFTSGYGKNYSSEFKDVTAPYTQSIEVMCMEPVSISVGSGARTDLVPGVWTRIFRTMEDNSQIRPLGITASGIGDIPVDTKLYHRRWKLEAGSKATDWTPAPEDTEAEIQAQANALAGYQLSNDTAVDDAKKAAQAAAGLAGEKGEVIYSTTTPPVAKRKAANLWIKGPANTPHVWNGSAWAEITDQAAKDAAKAAADANTLAKTKTTTYYQTSAPAASVSVVGDLWIDQSTAGKNTLKRWSGSAWVAVQDKAIAEAVAAAGTAQSTADGKVRTFAQTTAPTGMASKDAGDLWIDTDDGNKLYRWSGSAWVGVQDAAIAAAKKAADDAAEARKIHDTRSVNELPDFYWKNYPRTTVREFKSSSVLGTTGGYGVMTTVVPWTDHSGGAITQEFNVNNSDTVLYRRSTGAGATATWTAWKDRAKDLADSITAVGNDLAAKTGPNSTLQKNINSLDESTGKQYEDLNTQLWGDQGELNKLNSLLWDDQGKLNQATEIFKSNITGWKEDVYNAFIDFDKTNKYQDGLVAANNRAIKANTEAVSAHQRILQVAYPDSGSAIPMVPGGVNVGTEAAPVYEAMPEWLHAFGVTKVTGTTGMEDKRAAHATVKKEAVVSNPTKMKVNATALYRYSFWIQASVAGSEAFIRLLGQDGAGPVLENTPDVGMPAPRSSARHLYWFNGNVPTGWTKISGVIRLNPNVTHIYIDGVGLNYQGTVASQWLADIQLSAIIPSQSDVNKALSDVNDAQTAILSGHQDVLDMAFPNTNLVPMTNGVPEWSSLVSANPIRTPEGNWRFTSATPIQPGTGGKHAPTVNGIVYRAMVRLRRTGSAGTFGIRLRAAGSTTSITNLTAVPGKPAPAGASRTNFLTANPALGTDWETWYYDFVFADNTGDVRIGYVVGSTGVEVSQLSVVALLPSQVEVDAVQNEAIAANTKAIRLAFPDMNLDPQTSAGHPEWSTSSLVTVRTTGSLGGRNPSYEIKGRVDGGFMQFQSEIREYRIRGWITPGPGVNPFVYIYIMNESGTQIIEACRPTFPKAATKEEELAGSEEVKWDVRNNVLFSANGGNVGTPGEWEEMDVVVRLRPGETVGKVQLYSGSDRSVTLSDFRVTAFAPSQWQVDYAQNKALTGLAHSIGVQNEAQGELQKAIGENGLGGQVSDLEKTIRQVQSYIPRSMVMNLGSNTPTFENDHFRVYNNSGNVDIQALGDDGGWTGHAILTYVYGTSHETAMVEFNIPDTSDGSRRKVRSTQERVWRRMARLDYWVDNGEQVTKKVAKTPNVAVSSGWSTRTDMTFKVLEDGFHIINFKVEWPYTARNGVQYGVQIKRNGTVVNTLTETNIGPTFPWEDGRRSQSINWSGPLTKDQTITFEVFTSGTTTNWRTLGKEERRVSWVSN